MRCEKNTRGSQHTTDRKQADKAVQLPRIKYAPMPSAEVIKKKKKKWKNTQKTAHPSIIGEKKKHGIESHSQDFKLASNQDMFPGLMKRNLVLFAQ